VELRKLLARRARVGQGPIIARNSDGETPRDKMKGAGARPRSAAHTTKRRQHGHYALTMSQPFRASTPAISPPRLAGGSPRGGLRDHTLSMRPILPNKANTPIDPM
jgi:hypothetical protein